LLIAVFIIATAYKSVNYVIVASLTSFYIDDYIFFCGFDVHLLSLVGFFLFVGAVGKSAQLGLHTWLPDAMEGPTPVSALIHAATMVTAGVFLIIRNSFIFTFIPNLLDNIAIVGALTAFFASTVGLVQNDIKRVIAYSTCSQLGYMLFACGLSHYSLSFFHLSNHAFFKALLFLSAGSVIHAVSDEQDMRKMGGLKCHLPFTYVMMCVGSLALIGFPFLSGFYSKDLILEAAFSKYTNTGFFCYILGTCGAFLTSFYSIRLLYLIFLSGPNGHRKILLNAYESDKFICTALGFLAIPSIFIGYCSKDMFVGYGTSFFGNAICNQNNNNSIFDAEFISIWFKLLPVLFSLLGVVTALILYKYYSRLLFEIKMSFLGK
jgi:proton-translocating NADH-quinone oxidoreductase chain L